MSEQTAGVRLRGDSLVTFCRAGRDIRVGDWVVVPGSGGERQGCVVITEDQLVLTETESALVTVLRKVTTADLAVDPPGSCADADRSVDPGRQFGFGGPGHPSTARMPKRDTSIEDDAYRELKFRFPKLGDTVSTGDGEALVVGVNLRTSTLTLRHPDETETRTCDVNDVLARTDQDNA